MAASVTSPRREPSAACARKTAWSSRLRRNRSRLTTKRCRNRAATVTLARGRRPAQVAPAVADEEKAEPQAGVLGQHGRGRDARRREAEAEDQEDAERGVKAVHGEHEDERPARVLEAEQPAEQDEAAQRGRGAQHPDREIGREPVPRARLGRHDEAGEGHRERAQRHEDQPERRRDQEAAHQHRPQLKRVPTAQRLRGQRRRSHAEEAQHEVEDAGDVGAERHGREVPRVRQVADRGGVDHAEQRHRQVGEDQRPGEPPALAERAQGDGAAGTLRLGRAGHTDGLSARTRPAIAATLRRTVPPLPAAARAAPRP